jgi:ketosteroid isomerase-like protein
MTYLSEDPTYLVVGLGVLAGVFLTALKFSQQGKYLFWALGSIFLAGIILVIEQFWITDNERIEHVVDDIRRAVLASDAEAVLKHLTPDIQYVQNGKSLPGELTRGLIRTNLANATFDFVHLNSLQTSVGRQSRRGVAEFVIYAKGTLRTSIAAYNVGTANSSWSLGFEETAPGIWKVNRITPISVPEGAISVPSMSSSAPDVKIPADRKGRLTPSDASGSRPSSHGAKFRLPGTPAENNLGGSR